MEIKERGRKGLYIHVPFCLSKCKYCDFISEPILEKRVEEYIEGIRNEIEYYKNVFVKEFKFDTVYIGGGTPTSLSLNELNELVDIVFSNISLSSAPELSIEVNPLTLDEKKAKFLANYFNRLSLGLQTSNDRLLKILGRGHSFEDFLFTYELVLKYFDNINIDLIYGIPGQTLEDLERDIDKVLELSPTHVSLYALSLEEGTRLYLEINENQVNDVPSGKAQSEMYYTARWKLLRGGYCHYELSNFSKPGYKSFHNLNYWQRGSYLGIGVGAHSFWNNMRWNNPTDLDIYLKKSKKSREEKINYLNENVIELGFYEAFAENIFLGLRLTDGIELRKLEENFGLEEVKELEEKMQNLEIEGFIEKKDKILRLAPKGYMLANRVLAEILPDLDK